MTAVAGTGMITGPFKTAQPPRGIVLLEGIVIPCIRLVTAVAQGGIHGPFGGKGLVAPFGCAFVLFIVGHGILFWRSGQPGHQGRLSPAESRISLRSHGSTGGPAALALGLGTARLAFG